MKFLKNTWKQALALVLVTALLFGGLRMFEENNTAQASTKTSAQLTMEFSHNLVLQALRRIGHGYPATGGGTYGGTYGASQVYDCSGLVYSCFASLGYSGIPHGTAEWKSFLINNAGKKVTFADNSGKNELSFTIEKVVGSEKTQPKDVKPGTILFKESDGADGAHMAIALGNFNWDSSSKKTAANVVKSVIADYGEDFNKAYGKNLSTLLTDTTGRYIYGSANAWEYRTRSASVSATADTSTKTEYESVWFIDSLNTEVGVSINNNPYSKKVGTTITYLIKPDWVEYGNVELHKSDGNGKSLAGCVFAIYDADGNQVGGTVTTNSTGVATFIGSEERPLIESKQYIVRELSTVEGHKLADGGSKVKILAGETVYVGGSASYSVVNEPFSTSLQVEKKDEATGGRLTGAVFTVYEYSTTTKDYTVAVGTMKEQTKGIYTIAGLTWKDTNKGKFKVAETTAPAGYENSGWSETIQLTKDTPGVIKYTVENPTKKGTYEVQKVWNDDEDRDGVRPESIVVQLYKNGTAYGESVTLSDENDWKTTYVDLPIKEDGNTVKYSVSEVLPENYTSAVVLTKAMTENATGLFTITNTHSPDVVQKSINKVWEVGDESFIPDSVTMKLYQDGVEYSSVEVTADMNWTYTWKDLPKNHDGGTAYEYTVSEVVPDGWTMVQDGDIITNSKKLGQIQIEKLGETFVGYESQETEFGTLFTAKFESRYLTGAVFAIIPQEKATIEDGVLVYDAADVVATVVTGEDPSTSRSECLELGEYYVIETEAPYGYVLEDVIHEVTLEAEETSLISVEQVSAFNDYQDTFVRVYKEAEYLETTEQDGVVTSEYVLHPGVGFTFGLYNAEDIVVSDEVTVAKDSLMGYAVSDQDGLAVFDKQLLQGDYYVMEIMTEANADYEVNEDVMMADMSFSTAEKVIVATNEDNPFINTIRTMPVTITKADLTGSTYLADTEITVWDEDGQIIYCDKTDENGTVPNVVLMKGHDYTFQETYAPEGYAICFEQIAFSVGHDGAIAGYTEVRDDIQRFAIKKVDEKGTPLAGVGFTLYDEGGMPLEERYTDENGELEFSQLGYGTYSVVETSPLPGYQVSDYSEILIVDGTWANEEARIVVNSTIVQTGNDTSAKILVVTLILVVLLGATVSVIYARARKHEEE